MGPNLYTVSVYSFSVCHVVQADEARCNPGVWALLMLNVNKGIVYLLYIVCVCGDYVSSSCEWWL